MMIPDLRRRLRGEEGSNLLEYGLVVILFMTLLFGIMGMGMMLYAFHFVCHAAKDAARYAAVHGSSCNTDNSCSVADPDTGPATKTNKVVQDYVASIVPGGIDPTQVSAAVDWPTVSTNPTTCTATYNAPRCTVEVTVNYNFHWIFPAALTTPIKLSSTSEMIIAH